MKCAICLKELSQGKDRVFETLLDHVSDPNNYNLPKRETYECHTKGCPANGSAFFDEMGEVYMMKDCKIAQFCVDSLLEPMNSFARKLRMEEKYRRRPIPLIRVGWWKWEITRNFTCDEAGKIVRRRYTLQPFKFDGRSWVYYYSFRTMLFYRLSSFYSNRKSFLKDGSDFFKRRLMDDFTKQQWDTKNYGKVFHWYVNTFHKKLKQELLNK